MFAFDTVLIIYQEKNNDYDLFLYDILYSLSV